MKAYAQPAVYWLLAIAGLVLALALLSEGPVDALALVMLTIPLLGIGRHLLRGRANLR